MANNNIFDHCRYETAPGFTPTVAWRDGSHDNEIRSGVNVDALVEAIFGATSNRLMRHQSAKTLTAGKTFGPAEFWKTVISNAPGAATYLLPDVSYTSPGTRVTIRNIAATTISVATTVDPIDGSTAAVDLAQWASATFVSQQLPNHRWLKL